LLLIIIDNQSYTYCLLQYKIKYFHIEVLHNRNNCDHHYTDTCL